MNEAVLRISLIERGCNLLQVVNRLVSHVAILSAFVLCDYLQVSDPALLTHEYFESLVDQPFAVRVGENEFTLRLIEIRMLPPPKKRTLSGKTIDAATKRLPFSVYFRSEGETGLKQGTYGMVPPNASQPLNIFVVPLGFEEGGFLYEAIFT
jgi:hypothetical protein